MRVNFYGWLYGSSIPVWFAGEEEEIRLVASGGDEEDGKDAAAAAMMSSPHVEQSKTHMC